MLTFLTFLSVLFLTSFGGGRRWGHGYGNWHKHSSSSSTSDLTTTTSSPTAAPAPTRAPLICAIGDTEYNVLGAFGAWTSTRDTSCPSGWYCGALEYDITYEVNGENLYGFDNQDYSDSGAVTVTDQYCADPSGCFLYADGFDGKTCKVARWNYTYFQPTTCNEAENYNALTVDYVVDASFSCCPTDNCNENVDLSSCIPDNTLSDYISDIYKCWNNVKVSWMSDIFCDNWLYAWGLTRRSCCHRSSCLSKRSRKYKACRWRWRCIDELRTIIEEFGACACQASYDNNFDDGDDIISELIKNEWYDYCPNVDVSCDYDGGGNTPNLDVYWWYIKFQFALKTGDDSTADELQTLILETIEDRTGVSTTPDDDPSTITPQDILIRRRMKNFNLRNPVQIKINKLTNDRRRSLLTEDNPCYNPTTQEQTLGCDKLYTDIEIILETETAEDADFVASVFADEMDQALEDSTKGTVYDSVVETYEHIDHISIGTDGNEVILDEEGHEMAVNETNEYENLDQEMGNKSNTNKLYIFYSFIITVISYIMLF